LLLKLLLLQLGISALWFKLGLVTPLLLSSALLLALTLFLWPWSLRLIRRLDRASTLEGALECAWDHRQRREPIFQAQRRRALRAFEAARPLQIERRPSVIWLLPLLLWTLPFDALEKGPATGERSSSPIQRERGAVQEAEGAKEEPLKESQEGAQHQALQSAQDAGAERNKESEAAKGSGDPQLQGRRGGVGKQAGDRQGPPTLLISRERLKAEGAELKLRSQGHRLKMNAVVDPARPYPPRYHQAVSAYFQRR